MARPPADAVGVSSTIDPYADYDPQRDCATTAKPGTVFLHDWLIRRYPGTGSSGILRSCGAGGTSEHKDGRAFDWKVDARIPAQREQAYAFLDALFATDERGNPHALARRMGIMYVIFDDRIYGSYSDFAARSYTHSLCRDTAACSPTLRHLDHMHFSLSRGGANAQTSFYRARNVPAWPVLLPGTAQIDMTQTAVHELEVPADGTVVTTPFNLTRGVTYRLVADGAVRLGPGSRVADASCAWSDRAGQWVPLRRPSDDIDNPSVPPEPTPTATPTAGPTASPTGEPAPDPVPVPPVDGPVTRGVVVSGAVLDTLPWDLDCTTRTHEAAVTASTTSPLLVQYLDPNPGGNDGSVRVYLVRDDIKTSSLTAPAPVVSFPEPQPPRAGTVGERGRKLRDETLVVPANRPHGALTVGEVRAGARYRVRVTGTAVSGTGSSRARFDGACVAYAGRLRPQHTLDPATPDADHLSLRVAGTPVTLLPVPTAGRDADGPTGGACSTRVDHAYTGVWQAPATGRWRAKVWDPYDYTDNTGSLLVSLTLLPR